MIDMLAIIPFVYYWTLLSAEHFTNFPTKGSLRCTGPPCTIFWGAKPSSSPLVIIILNYSSSTWFTHFLESPGDGHHECSLLLWSTMQNWGLQQSSCCTQHVTLSFTCPDAFLIAGHWRINSNLWEKAARPTLSLLSPFAVIRSFKEGHK